jgi:hypothetical protein
MSLTNDIVAAYSKLPQVEAVVLAGSQTSGTADQDSDIDLYVYSRAEIPLSVRASIAAAASTTGWLHCWQATSISCLRMPHPGEKRLVEIASEKCAKVPAAMSKQVREPIQTVSQADQAVIERASILIGGLDDLLSAEGLDPAQVGQG